MGFLSFAYAHTDRVRFGDLDATRHLDNVAFLQLFACAHRRAAGTVWGESARIAYVTELLPEHDPARPAADFGLILAECHIAYRSPAFYAEAIVTRITPARLRRSSLRAHFRMESGVDGRRLADGWAALVGYDYASSAPTALPERLTEALHAAGATEDDELATIEESR